MLAIQPGKSKSAKCVPNILPCRINHNGPVDASEMYWAPKTGTDEKQTSHFRGRRLQGRSVKIPDGYRGVVVTKTDRILPQTETSTQQNPANHGVDEEMDDEEDTPEAVGIMEELAEFDQVVVWGHDVLPDEGGDAYIRGIEEWIGFANQIHAYPVPEKACGEAKKS